MELTHEREITEAVALCAPDGTLNPDAVGFSRRPLHGCRLTGNFPRKKRWNHWAVTTDECLLAITYAHVDYLGLAVVLFVDLATGRSVEKAYVSPLGMNFALPDEVYGGDIALERRHLRLAMREEYTRDGHTGTTLEAQFKTFRGHTLRAKVFVELPPAHETLNVVIPWGRSRFQFTSKHTARPARGEVTVDGRNYAVDAAHAGFGCLDFGRGIWPYRTSWNWGAGAGRTRDGRVLGLNLGGRWTDGTGMTENGLCVAGRLHKLGEDLSWRYDRKDFKRPWEVRAARTGRVGLTYTPRFEKRVRLELLALGAELHFTLGTYAGEVLTDEGERLEVAGLPGWAEELRARW